MNGLTQLSFYAWSCNPLNHCRCAKYEFKGVQRNVRSPKVEIDRVAEEQELAIGCADIDADPVTLPVAYIVEGVFRTLWS